MTDEDRPGFAEIMQGLAEMYGEKLSGVRVTLYFETLRDMPLAMIHEAMMQHLSVSKFFPRAAEIRALVPSAVQDAGPALETLMVAMKSREGYWGIPAGLPEPIVHAVNCLGGWRAITRMDVAELARRFP